MNMSLRRFEYAHLAIFLGSFLLFQVQPMFAKSILPLFGGTSAVWTTCLVSFQLLLLAGYSYAYILSKTSATKQVRIHTILIAVSAFIVLAGYLFGKSPMGAPHVWQPGSTTFPFLRVVSLLLVAVGLPYFVLSSTSPLFQFWKRGDTSKDALYSLYSVSNAGSLLGVVSYPIIVEPLLPLHLQFIFWSVGFCTYVILSVMALRSIRRRAAVSEPEHTDATSFPNSQAQNDKISARQCLSWIAIAACASALLIGTTNQICQNVAPVPLLWMLPLGLYLLSFILAFRVRATVSRDGYIGSVLITTAMVVYVLIHPERVNMIAQVAIYATSLFCCCMLCHKELYRTKPHPTMLTQFYLLLTAGGALGGVLGGLVAPLAFCDYYEYQISLSFCGILALLIMTGRRQRWMMTWSVPLSLTTVGLIAVLLNTTSERPSQVVEKMRNFYGTVRVGKIDSGKDGPVYWLLHGQIIHGVQYSSGPLHNKPISCFGEDTGVGLALQLNPARAKGGPMRVGVIGLGVGTLAAYGRPGDFIRFFEINPYIVRLARNTEYFTYLADCTATIDVVLGDARVALEREQHQGNNETYDVLVVDAFNSDAVPTHLLTLEAFSLYKSRLRPDGIIVVHLTNSYLDLVPVVWAVRNQLGMNVFFPGRSRPNDPAMWAILTCSSASIYDSEITKMGHVGPIRAIPVWTDNRTDLLRVFKRTMPSTPRGVVDAPDSPLQ